MVLMQPAFGRRLRDSCNNVGWNTNIRRRTQWYDIGGLAAANCELPSDARFSGFPHLDATAVHHKESIEIPERKVLGEIFQDGRHERL